jgi:hypothetical protein
MALIKFRTGSGSLSQLLSKDGMIISVTATNVCLISFGVLSVTCECSGPPMFRAATTICLEFGSLVAIERFSVDFRCIFFFIRTHFELINKREVSGMCRTLRKDGRKLPTSVFLSV